MEGVRGHRGIVTNDGVSVRVDAAERTVLQAVEKDGRSRAYHATSAGLWTSLDLHAFHHFTDAAALDGSMVEEVTERHLLRRLAFGVHEGDMPGEDPGSGTWGGALPPDLLWQNKP